MGTQGLKSNKNLWTPSQNRDSVSLICLVTRQRYKSSQHLCCLRSWKGKGKAGESGSDPQLTEPRTAGRSPGKNRGDRRHPALIRGQPAKHQPANGACTAPGSPRAFMETFFNSLCATRALFLMACTKANPPLTCSSPGPAACRCSPTVTASSSGQDAVRWHSRGSKGPTLPRRRAAAT